MMIMGGTIVPKYHLACEQCDREWWQWLGMKDPLPESCPHCDDGKPFKLMSKFVTIRKQKQEKKTSKQNVIDHIEDNREILKQMKEKVTK